MKDLQIYSNEDFGKVRGMMIDGVPYFVGKDVATALGYKKPQNAVATHVDEEDKTTALIRGAGSNYKSKTTLINESGLYSLILSSKLPDAKKFKRWVTSEVLPEIRKTGTYGLTKDYQRWLKTRQSGKQMRRAETDAIKMFIEYARAQYCTKENSWFYSQLSIFCNIGVGISPKDGRDDANEEQLRALAVLEGSVIKHIIINGITANVHYTRIWARIRQQFSIFLEVVFQNRQLLK